MDKYYYVEPLGVDALNSIIKGDKKSLFGKKIPWVRWKLKKNADLYSKGQLSTI